MKVLVACEESQEVTKAFRAKGHEAFSCDLQDCSGGHPEWHIKIDVREILFTYNADLVIAHPPCTRLANSGVRWLTSREPRKGYSWSETAQIYLRDDVGIWRDFYDGCEFVKLFLLYGKLGHKIAVEQPIHHKYAIEEIGNDYTQSIHPYQFGHLQKKETHLWLYGLPELRETNNVYNKMIELDYKQRATIHYQSPGPERGKLRSKTFSGIAKAMAEQWG